MLVLVSFSLSGGISIDLSLDMVYLFVTRYLQEAKSNRTANAMLQYTFVPTNMASECVSKLTSIVCE